MTDIFKIIGFALAGGLLSLTLKEYRKDFAVLVGIATAVAVLMLSAHMIEDVLAQFSALAERGGVEARYFTAVIKVVGVAYITQFAAEVLRDSGENAVALKVELAGKVFILGLTLPIIKSFLEVCIGALESI